MKYVIDTSVAIKTVIKEADSAKAIQLRDDYNNALHDLLAPDLFPIENGYDDLLDWLRIVNDEQ